jgi:DNA-binding response OmpR family regulator
MHISSADMAYIPTSPEPLVLICECSDPFLQQATASLQAAGFRTVTTSKLSQAVPIAQQERPQAVIISTDCRDLCSEAIQRIKAIEPAPALVVATTMPKFDKAWMIWQHGGHEVVFKPILSESDIRQAVVVAIDRAVRV